MFYKTIIEDHIRVPPDLFEKNIEEAVLAQVKKDYDGFISKDFGFVIDLAEVNEVGEGVIIAGDGAAYFKVNFTLLTFKPEMQEVVNGQIKDIADFGAFLTLGPIEGMIHVSQTMDDFVSFSKDKTLLGKDSKKVLKVGDKCKARIIAVSYKEINNPKIGLTMRQDSLGKVEWIQEAADKKAGKGAPAEKAEKASKK